MTISNILSFNLNKSQPRSKQYQALIEFFRKNTTMGDDLITSNLNNIFNIQDVSMRNSAIFASFLLTPNKELKQLLKPSYVNSIPYKGEGIRIKQKLKTLFNSDSILRNQNDFILNKSVDLIFNFSYSPKLRDDMIMEGKVLLQNLYFFNKQEDIKQSLIIDNRLKELNLV